MFRFVTQIRQFASQERGATTVEYSLIALLIAVASVPAFSTIAPKLNGTFSVISTALQESSEPPVAHPPGAAGKNNASQAKAGS